MGDTMSQWVTAIALVLLVIVEFIRFVRGGWR